jgi:hypothetical protein
MGSVCCCLLAVGGEEEEGMGEKCVIYLAARSPHKPSSSPRGRSRVRCRRGISMGPGGALPTSISPRPRQPAPGNAYRRCAGRHVGVDAESSCAYTACAGDAILHALGMAGHCLKTATTRFKPSKYALARRSCCLILSTTARSPRARAHSLS